MIDNYPRILIVPRAKIVLADFNNVVGQLPESIDGPNVTWRFTREFYDRVISQMQKDNCVCGF